MNDLDLSVELCGLRLKNPIIAASGTFGFGREHSCFFDLGKLGGIAVKGLTIKPRKGNPAPRIAETPSGILNSVGLQNPGLSAFVESELPFLKEYDTRIIVNIAGTTIDEYCQMAEKLSQVEVDFIELNISCPNVKQGGITFGAQPDMVYEITHEVKKNCRHPLIVKLSPNTGDIQQTAIAAEEGGADAISLINTLLGMAIDVHSRKPVLANIVGGLSGPAVRPIALRMVWEVSRSVNIPVVGMGGIMSGEDAISFLLAGATAVSVGTANLIDPDACIRVLMELKRYMLQQGIQDVKELVGGLKVDF
ncbi:MAG: dihydroorotate dehydrogenase [Clostridia bacterium]|jgi:dihydroorotate dehydrogenase (NAD+) catalytic subunit